MQILNLCKKKAPKRGLERFTQWVSSYLASALAIGTSFFSWGATMRLIGVSAGDHVAVPTQYDGTTVELGTGTDPDTVYTVSTTGDHINMRIVQFPQNIRIKSAKGRFKCYAINKWTKKINR